MVEIKARMDHDYLFTTRLKQRPVGNAASHFLPGQSYSVAEITKPTITHIKYPSLKIKKITAITFTKSFMCVSTELTEGCSEKQTFLICS